MSDGKKVFLGMPGYGKQTHFAGKALWNACADMSQVCVKQEVGSLLAQNFNALWCAALNMVLVEGKRVDYFAMLHDDIGSEDGWLDRLIAELEAADLDVLGVVIPIKDPRGLTSIAVDREDGDDWRPQARLTMREIYQLPETFTSDDLGHRILLNTGMWVCRFNPDWAKYVWFTINDRIAFNTAINRWQAINESEDWYFSRRLHARGLKIGATRKVGVIHTGEANFSNEHEWGTKSFDTDCGNTVSLVPGAFPYDVMGWLRPEEGKALADLARGKRVLEIGSYCGLSTICMARTAEHVTAVDYFDGRGTPQPENTLENFQTNIERYGVADKVEICHPDAEYPLPEYELAFIDGAHDADSVRADIVKVLDVLAADGLLVFHDYHSHVDPGVTVAVDELLAAGGELLSTTNTIAVVRPPAVIPLEV